MLLGVLGETYGRRMRPLMSAEIALLRAKWIAWIFRAFWKVREKDGEVMFQVLLHDCSLFCWGQEKLAKPEGSL